MYLFDLAGRVAVVTGGTRGIGLMIARGLLQAGASVYIRPIPRVPPVTTATLPARSNKYTEPSESVREAVTDVSTCR